MNTLTKATDTPKARKAAVTTAPDTETVTVTKGKATKVAPKATKAAAYSMSKVDSARFVKACKADTANLLVKIRVAGKPALAGIEPKAVRAALVKALALESIPASFASGVSHYCTAYALAASHGLQDDNTTHGKTKATALGAIYTIAHGAVPVDLLKLRMSEFVATSDETKAAEFVEYCKAVGKAKGKVAETETETGGVTVDPEDAIETETETETETVSPLEDVRALTKQLAALLENMRGSADYTAAKAYLANVANSHLRVVAAKA